MKVCFVGIGSIARRHIKNLRELFDDIHIDALHHNASSESNCTKTASEEFINNHYYDADKLPDDYDVIFITNPTKMHYDTLKSLHCKGKHFFIEKPVFMTGEEDIEQLNLREDSIYYVACPLRYTNVLQYVKNNIDFEKVYSVRCISSSYLPDWRPEVDYRKTYSAIKELGGGVEIDLIHEWDYVTWLLGYPKYVNNIFAKKSNLQINSNDVAVYIADYDKQIVEIHLDYFGKYVIRTIELFCDKDIVRVDLIKQKISWLNGEQTIDLQQDRNEYQKRELEAFFEMIKGRKRNDNSIQNAYKILRLARGI